MRLSRTVFDILSLIFQKNKEFTCQWPRPLQGQVVVRRLRHAMSNVYIKFEVSSLSRSSDLKGTKSLKWVTWRGHAHFRDVLSSVGWDLLCSTHILSLKCLRLPATKKRRATPNVKILVSSHPLGNLWVTYTVYLWLVGKRVVDFLLVLTNSRLMDGQTNTAEPRICSTSSLKSCIRQMSPGVSTQ